MDLKDHLSMSNEDSRLKTFKNWPFKEDSKCNVLKMVEAGFYFIGSTKEPDAVMCFLCCKSLDAWESEDDPWKEHQKHSPYCDFVKLGKREDELLFGEYMQLRKQQVRYFFNKEIDGIKEKAEEVSTILANQFDEVIENLKKNKS